MPSLKLMLAASEIPTPEHLQGLFPLLGSPKLDGVRSAMIEGVSYSRKMLPATNPFVQSWAAKYGDHLHGLDGEFVIGYPGSRFDGDDVFNRTSGPLGKMSGEPDFTYYVFERWNMPVRASARWLDLETARLQDVVPRVQLIAQTLLHNLDELHEYHASNLAQGFEGTMLKSPKGLYKNGRSTLLEGTLLKWKEFADSEAVVLAVNQGKSNQNEAKKDELGHTKRSTAQAGKVLTETVGSFTVRDIYTGVVFNCPPDGTEPVVKAMWDQYKADPQSMLGRVMTYKYQKVGSLRKPRFPGMRRWRPLSDISAPTPYLLVGKE